MKRSRFDYQKLNIVKHGLILHGLPSNTLSREVDFPAQPRLDEVKDLLMRCLD